jgi:hypothetical protein
VTPGKQIVIGPAGVIFGVAGWAFTVTVICALALSQPTVWLTQYEVLPVVAVEGVGAVGLPVPPVAVVYHNNPVPVAVRGTAVAFWQYVTGVVTPGASGAAFTVTLTVPAILVQPLTVAITEYVPAAAVVALVIEGFCEDDVKLLGPVQLYAAPVIFDAVRFKVEPSHTGLLLEAVGAARFGLTNTLTVPAVLVQLPTVAMTEYVPVAAVVALLIEGFCKVDVKPLGPVQL